MKKFFVIIAMLMLVFPALHAQNIDYLQKAREFLSQGDCERAEYAYQDYKSGHPKGNAEIEAAIKRCKEGGKSDNKSNAVPTTGTLKGQEDIPISNTGVTPVQTVVEIEEMVENKDEKNVSAVQLAIYDSVHNSSSVVSDTLYAKGISVYRNGEEIPESQLRIMFANTESYDLYVKGLKSDKNAKKMFWTGIALAGTGLLCQLGWVDPNLRNSNSTIGGTVGGGFCIAGLIVMFVGVTTEIIGSVHLGSGDYAVKKAVSLYNNSPQRNVTFNYGFTGNGIYLGMTF